MNRKVLLIVVPALCWLLVIGFALNRVALPPDLAAEPGAFAPAFEQTLEHLTQIAAEVHPVGSVAHDTVRDYIIAQIAALGFDVETQKVPVEELTGEPQWAADAEVTNIVTRLRGREPGKALLVTSHYDSVPGSYGAADAGAAVASMLTLLGTMQQDTLRNDVIFLFSDAEEPCLCGARAFVTGHPWARDVGVVINFEARGSAGPSLMFETSVGNGELVRQFASVATHPVTSSLFYEIYRVLPNNTDLTVYKVAEIPGINFAFIDGYRNYHTGNDNLESLDRNSLFHHYLNMEAMTQRFAGMDLTSLAASDVVFFDVLAFFVVSYPPEFAVLVSTLCAALLALLLFEEIRVGGRRKSVRLLTVLVVLPLAFAFIAWLLAFFSALSLPSALEGVDIREATTSKPRMLVFAVVYAGVFIGALRVAGKYFARLELLLPVLTLWLVILAALCIRMPGASYILMWPLLFMLLGIHLDRYCARHGLWANRNMICSVLFPMPLLIIWSQLVYAIFLALTLEDSLIISALTIFGLSLLSFYLLPAKTGAGN